LGESVQLNRVTVTKEPFGATLTSTYDADSRRTLVKDSFGGVLTSSYDKANNLTDRTYSLISGNSLDIGLGYTARNELNFVSRSTSAGAIAVFTNETFDPAGRVTFLKQANNQHQTLATYTYVYDAASRLTSEKLNGTTTTYQYDATNELTNDTANSYSYDLNGNRTMTGYTTGSANELTNDGVWTYTYDNEGNLTKKSKGASAETWFYGYDNVNHLTSAKQEQTDGGTLLMQATYLYDAYGSRLEKDVWTQSSGTTTTTRFAYDGQNDYADLDSGNNLVTRRVYGDAVDQLFARESSLGTVAWYLTDRLGSVRDITDVSSVVLDHIDFDGFGNITNETSSSSGDRYKWTCRELDTETGLQFNRARYYDAKPGRWTDQDPLGFVAADTNLYRYLRNNSPNALDPNGLEEWNIDYPTITLIVSIQFTFLGTWTLGAQQNFIYQYRTGIEDAWNNADYHILGNKVKLQMTQVDNRMLSRLERRNWKPKLKMRVVSKNQDYKVIVNPTGTSQTVGAASNLSAASINPTNTDPSQITAVHEFGHLLGLQHPGQSLTPPSRPNGGEDYNADAPSLMGLGMEMRIIYITKWVAKLDQSESGDKPHQAILLSNGENVIVQPTRPRRGGGR
jgi:RHS repeat-associated protein